MSSAAGAIQAAAYQILTGDATLTAMLGGGAAGVVDKPTGHQAFPYVVIGEQALTDFSAMGRVGQTGTLTLHTWSQGQGKQETQAIMSRIDALLNRAAWQSALAVAGFSFAGILHDHETVLSNPDGMAYHGIQQFRLWVTQ